MEFGVYFYCNNIFRNKYFLKCDWCKQNCVLNVKIFNQQNSPRRQPSKRTLEDVMDSFKHIPNAN